MTAFLKKDLLLILRDRGELLLLLLMPLLLIAILGFALGGLMGGSSGSPIHVQVGLVTIDDTGTGRTDFRQELMAADLPVAQRAGLLLASQTVDPVSIVQDFLGTPDLAELLTLQHLGADEAAERLEAGEIQAVVTIPAGFTAALFQRMFLDSGDGAELQVQLSDDAPLGTSVIRDVLQGFAGEFSLQTALQQIRASERGPGPVMPAQAVTEMGSIETVGSEGNDVSSFAYYAIGMAVMFMLYLVGSTASRSFLELSNFSFDRIIVSGSRPLAFLASKAVAAAVVGFVQIMLLLFVSDLLLGAFSDQPASFWAEAAVISAAMALSVGALAALVTAVVFRAENKGLADAFNSVVVFVFALVGGSFVPVGDSGSLLSRIGDWTPNGAALTALLSAAQGGGVDAWLGLVLRLVTAAALLLMLGLMIFPRMRSS